jgi:hypothetical protein
MPAAEIDLGLRLALGLTTAAGAHFVPRGTADLSALDLRPAVIGRGIRDLVPADAQREYWSREPTGGQRLERASVSDSPRIIQYVRQIG